MIAFNGEVNLITIDHSLFANKLDRIVADERSVARKAS